MKWFLNTHIVSLHLTELQTATTLNKTEFLYHSLYKYLQWGDADAEIEVPSVENTELKGSPSKAWSRSEYGHICYLYCQGFPPC